MRSFRNDQNQRLRQKSTFTLQIQGRDSETFTPAERKAMSELARERKAQASGRPSGDADVLAKIAEMPQADRELSERVYSLVKSVAPELEPKTWYGMPAWAKEGKVVRYFQSSAQFKSRYATFGFTDKAALDAGSMWPVAFALKRLVPAEEKKLEALLKKAIR